VLAAANTSVEGSGWAGAGVLAAQSSAPAARVRTALHKGRSAPFRLLPAKRMDASIANSTRVSHK
jgi:hypothetical protein